jgi:carboxypeptidase family protein
MNARRLGSFCAMLMLAAMCQLAHAAEVHVEPNQISGRVVNTATSEGIGGISVQLMAPRAQKQPMRVTATQSDGRFLFSALTPGKYLLTMYQGATLVFRKEIDTTVDTNFTVPLQPQT